MCFVCEYGRGKGGKNKRRGIIEIIIYETIQPPFSSEGGLLAFSISAINISKILAIKNKEIVVV